MRTVLTIAIGIILFFSGCKTEPDYQYAFRNPNLPLDERIENLIAQLSIEEKAAQLLYDAPAIDRLEIPAYNWWNECLHGVARAGKATVFPQAIGMAASFDTTLITKIGTVVSDEARAKYHQALRNGEHGIYQGLTFWTPNINIFRDPRWGRGMETYGEDPHLTTEIAVSYINSLQGHDPNYFKLIATAKHFVVHSGPEATRHSFDAIVSDRDFLDTYIPHFKATIDRANVQSFMCAYNRLDGEPCCGSGSLLNGLLRQAWDFDGYIVSDCWALVDFHNGHNVTQNSKESAAQAILSGTDLNCGSSFHSLLDALDDGLITEKDIDQALRRLLKARFQLGMFDPSANVAYAQIPYSVVGSPQHQKIALESAKKSMVLLKNDKHTLPLNKTLNKIAVLGPNAIDEEVLLANYNGHPQHAITPLEGIIQKVGSQTEVVYARGCDLAENLPFLLPIPTTALYVDKGKQQQGLKASFYNGLKIKDTADTSKIYNAVDVNWWENKPINGINNDNFTVKWDGYLMPDQSGEYVIGADGTDHYELVFDGDTVVHFDSPHGNVKRYVKLSLIQGKAYPISLIYKNYKSMAMVQLLWSPPHPSLLQEAITTAKSAEAVILCLGLSPRLEGEEMDVKVDGFKGGDRITLGLPKTQLTLMKAIMKLNKPTVLVLLNGSAIALNWENEHIPAILEAWYPGEAAGTAIADVLFGDYNPAGRLPLTFYKSVNDLPAFEEYAMKGRTYRYFDKEPLYPFGFGLSFTSFKYDQLTIIQKNTKAETVDLNVSIQLHNTGEFDGEEVVQLYIKNMNDPDGPIKSLKGFQRVFLKKGETRKITFSIGFDQLSTLDNTKDASVKPGTYQIMIGSSSANKDLMSSKVKINK